MLRLMLCGDVMLGRGIDQILRHPSDPRIYERDVQSADVYVELAEAKCGPIPRGVGVSYVWGDAIAALEHEAIDFSIVNLETAVTAVLSAVPKGINYRLNPRNADVIKAFSIDCCVLANNHVLDWTQDGLIETLNALRRLPVATAGAGANAAEAAAPALLARKGRGRVFVFAFATPTSGVPPSWGAGPHHPGVNLLPDLELYRVTDVRAKVSAVKKKGDIAIASIHWGGNWGHGIPEEQIKFAHALIDEANIDIVHGHSSHHPKAIEIWHDKLILYGCGDFLNDYEGIVHDRSFCDGLVLAYMAEIDEKHGGKLIGFTMLPFCIHKFRLNLPKLSDVERLSEMLNRECGRFGLRVNKDARKLKLSAC
jgi:poly-gamma-glutamate capsule biosynthesis protein CapA/YwtB (metallophosphatase superfamily)